LYYRINVIELVVPPLRDRGDDILELAEHILDRLAGQLGVECRELSPGARKALLAHPFPGNVRELENVLERAIALCEDGRIEAEDIQLRQPEPGPNPVRPRVSPDGESGLGDQVEELERAAIIQALEQTRYNKTQAARQLGITFRALRYRIKKLGIE